MKNFAVKVLKYAAVGIVVVPCSILTHEAGHFLAYHFFGAGDVRMHSASVSADKQALGSFQIAAASIVGPLISYLTIVPALVLTRKNYVPWLVILGLAAPLGRIVNFIYIYFRALGYNPQPNFDEFNFSRSLGLEPLWLSIVTALIVLTTFWLFFEKTWKTGGFKETAAVIFSLVCGLSVWMLLGRLILP